MKFRKKRPLLYEAAESEGEVGWFIYMRNHSIPVCVSECYDTQQEAKEVADRWNKHGSRWGLDGI